MNMSSRCKRVSWDEAPFWSSLETRPNHQPSQAFELLPWISSSPKDKKDDKFSAPQTVWYKFAKPVKIAKFAFSSRVWSHLDQSPTQFALVGSDDCVNWVDIKSYNTQFTKLNEEKTWTISANERQEFKCFGIKVEKVKKGPLTAISHLRMWKQGEL